MIIKGHWRNLDGTLEPGRLDTGRYTEAAIYARKYRFAHGSIGTELAFLPEGPDDYAGRSPQQMPDGWFDFLPDAGECERLGIPMAPLED